MTIVEIVPLILDRVLGKRRVMTTTSASHVVTNTETIVDQFAFILRLLGLWKHEIGQVETFKREIDQSVEFAARKAKQASNATFAGFKALQGQNEQFRHAEDLKCFLSLNEIFAFITIPHIVLIEDLTLFQFTQAIF